MAFLIVKTAARKRQKEKKESSEVMLFITRCSGKIIIQSLNFTETSYKRKCDHWLLGAYGGAEGLNQ